jgi:diadenosine tetraphosphate (Ap4A) HIT family hydrolase
MLAPWSELHAGRGCPLCAPRPAVSGFSYFVCKLTVSSLYLARNQAYHGTCTVVYDPAHVARPSDLPDAAWRDFCANVWAAERAVSHAVKPDHINLECLGNTVPHLHMSIIPRYRSDPRWGRPIWTTKRSEMAQALMTEDDCERLAQALRGNIAHAA